MTMQTLKTWANRSKFRYEGSIKEGTKIIYGRGWSIYVPAERYRALLEHCGGRTVNIGTSRTTALPDSVGQWL